MRKIMLTCLAVLGLYLCGESVYPLNAQTYGQVQWGQQMNTSTPNVAVFDGVQNVPIGQLDSTLHKWAPYAQTTALSDNSSSVATTAFVKGVSPCQSSSSLGFVAGVAGTCAYTGTGALVLGDQADYLSTYAYFGGNAGLLRAESGPLSVPGATGAVFSTRTKNNTSAVGYAAGNVSWFFQDNPTYAVQGAGRYTEARRYPSVPGPALGQELEITEFGTSTALTPYTSPALANLSVALWFGSGGGCVGGCYNPLSGLSNLAATSAGGGINFINNGATFRTGINFGAGSLTGDNGGAGGGFGTAISMANGQALKWYSPDGTVRAVINSSELNTGYSNYISFADEALNFGGHLFSTVATGRPAPSVVTCGGSPTIPASATDVKGQMTVGSGTVSSCQLNFGTPYAGFPTCVVTSSNQGYAVGLPSVGTTGFVVAFTPAVTTAETVYYHCIE